MRRLAARDFSGGIVASLASITGPIGPIAIIIEAIDATGKIHHALQERYHVTLLGGGS